MAELESRFSEMSPIVRGLDAVGFSIVGEDSRIRGLRYSSPWPWIFAGIISLAMWTSAAWLVWVSLE